MLVLVVSFHCNKAESVRMAAIFPSRLMKLVQLLRTVIARLPQNSSLAAEESPYKKIMYLTKIGLLKRQTLDHLFLFLSFFLSMRKVSRFLGGKM